MISLICASNNKDVLNKMLMDSLSKQVNAEYELIIIDGKEHSFKSAAEALNYGSTLAKGDLLVFVHQDIVFKNEYCLEKIIYLARNYKFGIAGIAGATGENEYEVSSSVTIGESCRQAGKRITDVIEAYSLDEVLLIVKKDDFVGFSDYGDTWHFYGVEYSIKQHNAGKKVLLFPIDVYHASDAKSLNYSYFDTLLLYGKRNKKIKLIRTCCGYFKNNMLLRIYCNYRKLKLFVKKILRKK